MVMQIYLVDVVPRAALRSALGYDVAAPFGHSGRIAKAQRNLSS